MSAAGKNGISRGMAKLRCCLISHDSKIPDLTAAYCTLKKASPFQAISSRISTSLFPLSDSWLSINSSPLLSRPLPTSLTVIQYSPFPLSPQLRRVNHRPPPCPSSLSKTGATPLHGKTARRSHQLSLLRRHPALRPRPGHHVWWVTTHMSNQVHAFTTGCRTGVVTSPNTDSRRWAAPPP
jgi:hypothetical protein